MNDHWTYLAATEIQSRIKAHHEKHYPNQMFVYPGTRHIQAVIVKHIRNAHKLSEQDIDELNRYLPLPEEQ